MRGGGAWRVRRPSWTGWQGGPAIGHLGGRRAGDFDATAPAAVGDDGSGAQGLRSRTIHITTHKALHIMICMLLSTQI